MRILLPTSLEWDLTRFDSVEPHLYDPNEHLDPSLRSAEAVAVWGNSSWQVKHLAEVMKDLKWVQGLAAGPDALIKAGFPPEVTIASGRGLHDQTVAEHSLALILACARRLHLLRDVQKHGAWRPDLAGADEHKPREAFRTIFDSRITIWGFGSIALALAPLLETLGAEVKGIATRSGTRGGVEVVSTEEADVVLPQTDVLVSILPKTDTTERLIGRQALEKLPRHAWLVNVGRGGTVDEEALLSVLLAGKIAGAALDVFEEEPLPASSPFWSMENVLITPHAAGGRPLGAQELVLRNLTRFLADEPLENEVDRQRGY